VVPLSFVRPTIRDTLTWDTLNVIYTNWYASTVRHLSMDVVVAPDLNTVFDLGNSKAAS